MSDEQRIQEPLQPLNQGQAAEPAKSPGCPEAPAETGKELSADEQMALYEKSLKEDDWGHQPC